MEFHHLPSAGKKLASVNVNGAVFVALSTAPRVELRPDVGQALPQYEIFAISRADAAEIGAERALVAIAKPRDRSVVEEGILRI
jgi:hypothetical protein